MRGYGAGKRSSAAKAGDYAAAYAFGAVAAFLFVLLLVLLAVNGAFATVIGLGSPAYAVLQGTKPLPAIEREPVAALSVLATAEETEAVAVSASLAPALPQVLIYHTHATEAYLMADGETYEPTGNWRTADTERNIVAIGAMLKEELMTVHGIGVLHDASNFEPPKLSSAYSRSLTAMEAYRSRYPSVTMFVDVHRDAYGKNEDGVPKDFIELDGRQVARLMCVVGTGEGATGGGFGEKPDFEANLALAQTITDRLREADGRLARDIRVKTGRYNQHVSDTCLLVEVGHTANTLTQAKNAVPYLAAAIASAYRETRTPAAVSAPSVWAP